MGLVEVTNLHYRDLVDGFLEHKTVEETFSYISRDSTLSHAYLDRLKSIYASPAYQDWSEAHPLREKKLKKEIIDAWVEEWRRMNRLQAIGALHYRGHHLPATTVVGRWTAQKVQAEVNIALSVHSGKGD